MRLIFQMDNAGSHYFRIHPKRSINATGKMVHLPALITKAVYRRVVLTPLSEQCLRIKQFTVHRQTCTRIKKKVISARFRGYICELKYYEPRHQSESCNFIKPSSDFARCIVVTVNRAEVIVWKSEKKRRKKGRWGRRRRRRTRVRDDN